MATTRMKKKTSDIPAQVFENFLQALIDAKMSPEAVARLRKTLLEDKSFTERALRDAIFGEEVQP
jgi:hypothetical protein